VAKRVNVLVHKSAIYNVYILIISSIYTQHVLNIYSAPSIPTRTCSRISSSSVHLYTVPYRSSHDSIQSDVTPAARYNLLQWTQVVRAILEFVYVFLVTSQFVRNGRHMIQRHKEVSPSSLPPPSLPLSLPTSRPPAQSGLAACLRHRVPEGVQGGVSDRGAFSLEEGRFRPSIGVRSVAGASWSGDSGRRSPAVVWSRHVVVCGRRGPSQPTPAAAKCFAMRITSTIPEANYSNPHPTFLTHNSANTTPSPTLTRAASFAVFPSPSYCESAPTGNEEDWKNPLIHEYV
jgi:hypothetical protein